MRIDPHPSGMSGSSREHRPTILELGSSAISLHRRHARSGRDGTPGQLHKLDSMKSKKPHDIYAFSQNDHALVISAESIASTLHQAFLEQLGSLFR